MIEATLLLNLESKGWEPFMIRKGSNSYMGQFSQDGNLVHQFPFFDGINSNGVIRIMTFKSLQKICWIDNSLCTLEKKFENILKNLKI